jgi:hypothetical protein
MKESLTVGNYKRAVADGRNIKFEREVFLAGPYM